MGNNIEARYAASSLYEYEKELLEYAMQQLNSIDGLRIYGTAVPKISVLSFTIDGIHPLDAATILNKLGIAIRTGHLCAEPLMRRFGVSGMMRVSLAFYNTKEEIDILVAGLKKAQSLLR